MTENKKCCCSGGKNQSCSSSSPSHNGLYNGPIEEWMIDFSSTKNGQFPIVGTELTPDDLRGELKVRLGVNRMKYLIPSGLYGIGKPDENSPVLVTANYKLTFDQLRKELHGLNAWILVLDTKGVNVWCAAGKGTFSTDELVRSIRKVGLSEVVAHQSLILPQLGAPGISAHLVTKATGFKVIYGPIRAEDIKAFLTNGLKATSEMREVRFTFKERAILTPIEFLGAWKLMFIIFAAIFIFNLINEQRFSLQFIPDFLPYLGAVLTGSFLVPLLLPWIPGRAFAWKGWILGLLLTLVINLITSPSSSETVVYLLTLPALSAFLALNFTGTSPYTSLSGVLKEMKYALPLIIISGTAGIILKLVTLF